MCSLRKRTCFQSGEGFSSTAELPWTLMLLTISAALRCRPHSGRILLRKLRAEFRHIPNGTVHTEKRQRMLCSIDGAAQRPRSQQRRSAPHSSRTMRRLHVLATDTIGSPERVLSVWAARGESLFSEISALAGDSLSGIRTERRCALVVSDPWPENFSPWDEPAASDSKLRGIPAWSRVGAAGSSGSPKRVPASICRRA